MSSGCPSVHIHGFTACQAFPTHLYLPTTLPMGPTPIHSFIIPPLLLPCHASPRLFHLHHTLHPPFHHALPFLTGCPPLLPRRRACLCAQFVSCFATSRCCLPPSCPPSRNITLYASPHNRLYYVDNVLPRCALTHKRISRISPP